jgi:hypothetical protein
MATRNFDRTGILILRLWVESSTPDGLRARITQTLDSTDREQATATAANPEDIYALVQAWVEAFVDQGSPV